MIPNPHTPEQRAMLAQEKEIERLQIQVDNAFRNGFYVGMFSMAVMTFVVATIMLNLGWLK